MKKEKYNIDVIDDTANNNTEAALYEIAYYLKAIANELAVANKETRGE